LGGLTTPRAPVRIIGGNGFDVLAGRARVVSTTGNDVTLEFVRGARKALEIIRLNKVTCIILKERSPSCAVHQIYRGKTLIKGVGVTAALFSREGFQILSEEEIDKLYA